MCSRASLLVDATRWEKDLKYAQQEDADTEPVVMRLKESSERLQWEQVAMASPATKFLWRQWSVFRLKEGVLQLQWETSNVRVKFW